MTNLSDQSSGALTFLFTDIEGSTKRWETDEAGMRVALGEHDNLLRSIFEDHAGKVFKHTGDGMCCVFQSPTAAVTAAIAAQRLLNLPVRMGIATGEVEQREGDYFGPVLNRVARVMSAGHGGQILLAASTANLLPNTQWIDLGPCRLRDLSEAQNLFQVVADGLARDFPDLRTMDSVLGNIPQQTTSFVGRTTEIATVREMVSTHRLVTLVGVGGVGKTRLAIQALAEVVNEYRDGIWVVELAPIADGSGLTEAIASIFSLSPQAGSTWESALIDFLSTREIMLLLDNCEHLLDAIVPLVGTLLSRCPNVRIVATSREALGVAGEWMWPVPSLDTGPGSAATELFVERARAVAPEFVAEGSIDLIVEICRRLDAIPLAIELAAARIRSMSAEQIRDRLNERFRLLTGTRRSSDRHQTLRTAVQWSYDLLDDTEKLVLQYAATFSDGFTAASLAEVYDSPDGPLDEFDMFDLIDSLVRKSLVQTSRVGGVVRFSLLETIRQFAEEYLAESGLALSARDRHARHYAQQAENYFKIFRSDREVDAYTYINHEISNVRAAFRWAQEREMHDEAIIIAACSHEIARFALRSETYEWPGEMVDLALSLEHRMIPLLLAMAADSAWARGLLEEAKERGEASLTASRSGKYKPFIWACADLTASALLQGDLEKAYGIIDAAAHDPVDEEDRFCSAFSLYVDAITQRPIELDDVEARSAIARRSPMPSVRALGVAAHALHLVNRDLEMAKVLTSEALELAVASGNVFFHGLLVAELSEVLSDESSRWENYAGLLEKWSASGDTMIASALVKIALVVTEQGSFSDAVRIYSILSRGVSFDSMVEGLSDALATVRAELGPEAVDEIVRKDSRLTVGEGSVVLREIFERARLFDHAVGEQ